MSQDSAALARRLVTLTRRAYVGVPVETYVVQMRSAGAGWPDWIDVSETMDRVRALTTMAEIAAAAAECPDLGIELQLVERKVLQ